MLSFLAVSAASKIPILTKIQFGDKLYVIPKKRMPMLIHAIHQAKRGFGKVTGNYTQSRFNEFIDFIEEYAKQHKIGKQTEEKNDGSFTYGFDWQKGGDWKAQLGFDSQKWGAGLQFGKGNVMISGRINFAESAEGQEQSIYFDEVTLEDGTTLILPSRHADTFDDLKQQVFEGVSVE